MMMVLRVYVNCVYEYCCIYLLVSLTCFFLAEMDGKIFIVFVTVTVQTLYGICLAGNSKVYNIIKSLLYCNYSYNYSFSNLGFAEIPLAIYIIVSDNQDAVFRCRHERADFIVWQINGLRSTQYSDVVASSIEESNGIIIVPTLTIPAIPVYNGSEVVCIAIFIDGSPTERTPPVTLTILSGLL